MKNSAIIDSGPLIALFNKDDKFHKTVTNFMKSFSGELISSTAVITEVMHILGFNIQVQTDFLKWIVYGAVSVKPLLPDTLRNIYKLFRKYSDVPMDFADASLVALSEEYEISDVISIDSDFYIYRPSHCKYYNMLLNIRQK